MIRSLLLYSLCCLCACYARHDAIIKLPVHIQKSSQIYDLQQHKLINSIMPNKLMDAASTAKIFTAVAAVEHFGMQFKYKTRLLSNAIVKSNTVHGDVFLQFSGDPSLTVDKLSALFAKLNNVNKIKGNIVVVNKPGKLKYGPGWMLDDLKHCYAPHVSNMNLNNNCVTLIADKNSKNKFDIKASIPNGVKINNKLYWQKKCKHFAKIIPDKDGYSWQGCLSRPHFADEVAVNDMSRWVKSGVKLALKKANIQLDGKVLFRNFQLNSKYSINFFIESIDLDTMLKMVLKDSDNLVSSSLFLSFDSRSWYKSKQWLHKFLNLHDIDNLNLVDGSGLSRFNKISAANLLSILKIIANNNYLYVNIANNLAVFGKDGTLEHSNINIPKDIKIVGKTGSMSGVDAICGYVLQHNKPRLIYVLILNSAIFDKNVMRRYRDKWLENLVKLI